MPNRVRARRVIDIGNDTCLLGFSGRDFVQSAIFDSSSVVAGGVNEVQTITINGVPTGGNYKLGYKGEVTANIAFNAAASAVQTALQALALIGPGGAIVTGSAGGPYTVTFGGRLAARDVDLLYVAANALTGGTSPAPTVAETTKGDATYAGLRVLRSGMPLMLNGAGTMVVPWDGASATTLVGIFDGQRELLPDEYPTIPVYQRGCVFDKDVVQNYSTWTANYNTWATANGCKFASQGH
jgi:hypothetical protein